MQFLHKVAYWHQHAERQPAETDHAKRRGTPAGVDSRKGAECGISVSGSLVAEPRKPNSDTSSHTLTHTPVHTGFAPVRSFTNRPVPSFSISFYLSVVIRRKCCVLACDLSCGDNGARCILIRQGQCQFHLLSMMIIIYLPLESSYSRCPCLSLYLSVCLSLLFCSAFFGPRSLYVCLSVSSPPGHSLSVSPFLNTPLVPLFLSLYPPSPHPLSLSALLC